VDQAPLREEGPRAPRGARGGGPARARLRPRSRAHLHVRPRGVRDRAALPRDAARQPAQRHHAARLVGDRDRDRDPLRRHAHPGRLDRVAPRRAPSISSTPASSSPTTTATSSRWASATRSQV
jgi:hypothetical protein